MQVVPLGAPGSSYTPPAARLQIASGMTNAAQKFKSVELKRNVRTIADEIRKHKNARQLGTTPALQGAIDPREKLERQTLQESAQLAECLANSIIVKMR